jgi:hypothetical protein
MRVRKRYLYGAVLSLGILGSISLWEINRRENFTRFWGDNQSLKRMPAKEEDKSRDTNLYSDFFMPNTFGRMIDYKIVPRILTDEDGAFVKEKLHEVIQSSLVQSILKSESGENPFHHNLKNNLLEQFIKRFVTGLDIIKVQNGSFQVDLEFIPKENRNFNFNQILNSNSLINHYQKGNLTDFLTDEEKPLTEIVAGNNIPLDGHTYQYMGGIISIRVNIPKNETLEQQNVKGTVRYRRFIRVNRLPDIDFYLEKDNFKVDYIHFKRDKNFYQPFMTVDIHKSFSLNEMTPKLKTLSINFGDILPSLFDRKGVITNLVEKKSRPVSSGIMKFHGEFNQVSYVAEVSDLIWDFEKGNFSKNSNIKILLTKKVESAGEIKNQIKDHLLRKYGYAIIDSFELERFHKEVKNL